MVRLLLDTHALLWWMIDDPLLSRGTRDAISGATEVALSVVNVWELATKIAIGKLRLDLGDLLSQAAADGFAVLPVTQAHCLQYAALPLHHRDPFDRMLVAQALGEGLTLVTSDPRLPAYGVPTLAC